MCLFFNVFLFKCAFLALCCLWIITCCLFYMYFRLKMILNNKQIWVIFLFKLQMDSKTVQTTCNINTTFGPGTANEHTVQWWFKKFCKGDERLEDEELSGRHSEVNNNQLRGSLRLILLQLLEKLPKDSTLLILQLFGILSKLERWKSSKRGASWTDYKSKNKKNHHFQVLSSLILYNNTEPFLDWIGT